MKKLSYAKFIPLLFMRLMLFSFLLCLPFIIRYCLDFEVIKATKACRKDPQYKLLEIGDRITVKCDLEAFVTQNEKDDDSNSTYSSSGGYRENQIDRDEDNETIDERRSPRSSSKKSKFRCKGEGVTGKMTRFGALGLATCHGKWLRLTVDKPKRCTHHDAQYIFV